jgi:hypothetical protein
MQLGDLFELEAGGPVYRVDAQDDSLCEGCVARDNFDFCIKLPDCTSKDGEFIFRQLLPVEAQEAREKGVKIEIITKNE